MRIIVVPKPAPPSTDERRFRGWHDPVTDDEASDEQCIVMRERLDDMTYILVPGVGICEPLEHRNTEAAASARMVELAAKHTNERFTLVFTIG